MSSEYAKTQPNGFINKIENVAIIGAGGHMGKHFTEALLKSGKQSITAISRQGSKSVVPAGVKVINVDYDDEDALVSALRGHQFLIITLSAMAPHELHGKLVHAAAKAGVSYVMPNIYTHDIWRERRDDVFPNDYTKLATQISDLGMGYVAMICGFWYEWSLAMGEMAYGIDIKTKKAVFFNEGKDVLNTSTWNLCGEALASLLSLKVLPEDEHDKSLTLSQWRNKRLLISSFKTNQREMLDSIHRVMGTTDADWVIEHQVATERYEKALVDMKKGERIAFGRALYTRYFFGDGSALHDVHGLANEALGLQKEDMDVATKRAVDMVEGGWTPYG